LALGRAFANGNAAVNGNGNHGGSNSTGVSGRPNMPLGVSGMVDNCGGNALGGNSSWFSSSSSTLFLASTSSLASSPLSLTIESSVGWPPGRVKSDVAITDIGLSGPACEAAIDDVVDIATPTTTWSSPRAQGGSGKSGQALLHRNFWYTLGSCAGFMHTHFDQLKASRNPLPHPQNPAHSSSIESCVTTGLALSILDGG
jgi:hypothetical protein